MNKAFEKIIEKLEELHERYINQYGAIGVNPMAFSVKECMEIVKQEAEQYKLYDTISIHTNGLEEGIRCAVCTNQIKSDTGCDGGCCVDENLVKRICDVIHKFECKPYQPKGE